MLSFLESDFKINGLCIFIYFDAYTYIESSTCNLCNLHLTGLEEGCTEKQLIIITGQAKLNPEHYSFSYVGGQ